MADGIPTMTGNTTPSGTASASTALSATYAAWKAMDDDTATWWSTTAAGVTPCWLSYSWGNLNTKIITSYTVRARSGAGNQDGAPNAWTFQGYNGSTWTTLDTQSGQSAWGDGEQRTFSFSNTTSYQSYRLSITANNGGTYTEIAEVEMVLGDPRCRIELAGVQILCRDPRCRIELAGVSVAWILPAPQKAINPDPADEKTGVAVSADLSWEDGGDTDTYDVYFGTDPEALDLVSEGQTATTYDPGTMDGSTVYYWRIDSTNDTGTTTGDVWSFTTKKASNMWLGMHF